ncbi:MAG TPA: hypothetical protein VMZ27_03735 [Candidatus Saccharimonadales bacterium]|nr:hypothetical protein [Candidatus Saccharimonadales bacterium]
MFTQYGTILLGEPDSDDAFFFNRTLQSAGYNNPVQVVHTGPEVISYLEGFNRFADRERYPFPSYVFLENYLPLLTGLEVLSKIPHFLSFVPFFLFVEDLDHTAREKASELGVTATLMKPFRVQHLGILRERTP